jgi:tetratricopeptide (TPR) repeat protein
LKDWAEAAYRDVIDQAPADSTASIQASLVFPEMLHDDARDQEAAKTLEHFVTRIRKDPAVAEEIKPFRDVDSIAARMHYFFAQHQHRAGDHRKEKEHLTKANSLDPNDADILIAMYHLPSADGPWRTSTQQKITAAGNLMQRRVQRLRQYLVQVEAAGEAENVKLARDFLAVSCNEYAWLLANTQSDVDEAIRLSRESLELRPDHGGFLDTLAHGYHTKGDFENAVKYQRKAAEIEPHSGQIARQLKVFEESLAKSKRKE